MLTRKLMVVVMTALFSVALGGIAFADIGTEAGNWQINFSSPDQKTMGVTSHNVDKDRLARIGTEAGDWESTSVPDKALQAALNHDYDQDRLNRIGTEAGDVELSPRQNVTCVGDLC